MPDLGVRVGDLTQGNTQRYGNPVVGGMRMLWQRFDIRATNPFYSPSRWFSKPGTRITRYRVFSFEERLRERDRERERTGVTIQKDQAGEPWSTTSGLYTSGEGL